MEKEKHKDGAEEVEWRDTRVPFFVGRRGGNGTPVAPGDTRCE